MKELVDLYAKLILGTFTFIGPSFTLLISLFSRQLVHLDSSSRSRLQTMLELGERNSHLQSQLQENIKLENLLNPKRQVRRLFLAILLALTLVAFYYFQCSAFWPCPLRWVKALTLLASAASYVYCLLVLWQVFGVIITAKQTEESEVSVRKEATSVKLANPQVVPAVQF